MNKFSKVTMILRGYTLNQVDTVIQVLKESKHIRNVEVALNTENAIHIITEMVKKYGLEMNIGAGTVTTFDKLKAVHEAGATFVLSPVKMTEEMLDFCKEKNILSIPGSYSPTEIFDSYTSGGQIIKVFPANELGLSYAKKVKEPLGDIPLMAVGGINKENVIKAFEQGFDYVGSAGGIIPKSAILNEDKDQIRVSVETFDAIVHEYMKKINLN